MIRERREELTFLYKTVFISRGLTVLANRLQQREYDISFYLNINDIKED